MRGRAPAPEPVARAAVVALALWAPTVAFAGLVWVLVPGLPARAPFTDPMLHFILSELLWSIPYVTVFGTLASLLAVAVQRGIAGTRRFLQATLVVGTVVPFAFGLWIVMSIPIPDDVGPHLPFRLLFSLPVVVGTLISGVPAVLAVWLLEQPEAR